MYKRQLTNRRRGLGRNVHQIQISRLRQRHGLANLHDAKLIAVLADYSDFSVPNLLVDEQLISDRKPLLTCLYKTKNASKTTRINNLAYKPNRYDNHSVRNGQFLLDLLC